MKNTYKICINNYITIKIFLYKHYNQWHIYSGGLGVLDPPLRAKKKENRFMFL